MKKQLVFIALSSATLLSADCPSCNRGGYNQSQSYYQGNEQYGQGQGQYQGNEQYNQDRGQYNQGNGQYGQYQGNGQYGQSSGQYYQGRNGQNPQSNGQYEQRNVQNPQSNGQYEQRNGSQQQQNQFQQNNRGNYPGQADSGNNNKELGYNDQDQTNKYPHDSATTAEDKKVNDQIREKFRHGKYSNDIETIVIETSSGVVTITGEVEKPEDIDRITRKIKEIDGVNSVNNQLTARNS
jgi:osmotically-inducible protein OsmY